MLWWPPRIAKTSPAPLWQFGRRDPGVTLSELRMSLLGLVDTAKNQVASASIGCPCLPKCTKVPRKGQNWHSSLRGLALALTCACRASLVVPPLSRIRSIAERLEPLTTVRVRQKQEKPMPVSDADLFDETVESMDNHGATNADPP
jgi:hypothetical protein